MGIRQTLPDGGAALAADFSGYPSKATPVDADTTIINDSAASGALKRLTWANLKATLKTYFDTLYPNVSGESVLGANFQITAANGTYQDSGLSLSLPAAGTYLVQVDARFNLKTSTTGAGFLTAKLYDATAAADVANSERLLFLVDGTTDQRQGTSVVTALVTVTGASTVKLYVKRDSGSWTNSFLNSNSDGRTTMRYVRLS